MEPQQLITILKRQQIAAYIETFLPFKAADPQFKVEPRMVQVVNGKTVTDGNHQFPCRLSRQVQKGMHIRMTNWELDFKTFEIVVHEFQVLTRGSQYVCYSKPWKPQKVKSQLNSANKLLPRDFVVLFEPHDDINEPKLEPFDYRTMQKVFRLKQPISEDSLQISLPKKIPYICEL